MDGYEIEDDDEFNADTDEIERDREGWANSRMAMLVELGIGSVIPQSFRAVVATLFNMGKLAIIGWTDWLANLESYPLVMMGALFYPGPAAGDELWVEIQCWIFPPWILEAILSEEEDEQYGVPRQYIAVKYQKTPRDHGSARGSSNNEMELME
jgi:hypothetical protein